MILCYIFILLGIDAISINAGVTETLQGIAVIGKLTCGTKPISGVQVQIWEEDPGNDPDDLLNTTFSDAKGAFGLFGQDVEATTIEPYLVINHNCDNGVINPNCTVIDEYSIPKEFVGKTYNMHTISLNTAGMNHRKKCE
uniref:Transthyretin-like family protein n=1 Tax=Onchocerca volvulus TaxID=6282 RepID=A0A8R1U213_ONCVO